MRGGTSSRQLNERRKNMLRTNRSFLFGFFRSAPDIAARDGRSRRIEEHGRRVEAVAIPCRPVDAPAIAKDRRQACNEDVPMIAGAVFQSVEFEFGKDFVRLDAVEHQPNIGTMPAGNDEVDSIDLGGRSHGQAAATGSAENGHGVPEFPIVQIVDGSA